MAGLEVTVLFDTVALIRVFGVLLIAWLFVLAFRHRHMGVDLGG